MARQHGGELFDFSDMTDDEIRQVVIEHFREYPNIDANAIEVTVRNGHVMLEGRVGTDAEVQVASAVLDRTTQPIVLVGPNARPPCAGDAPIVVAVDGQPEDRAVVAVAADWARMLGRRLVVATVAEPVPGSFEPGRPPDRMRGPADPEAYVDSLAAGASAPAVDSLVVYDPISVRGGLVRMLDRTAGLLVAGAHRRTRPMRALVGSHVARIVHDIEVPALVVPLGIGG